MIKILLIVSCHLIGDYVLQSDFIAKTKDKNLYHLFIHCFLYCLPFVYIFGNDVITIGLLFISHFLIDTAKAKFKIISYFDDQCLHYLVALLLF